MPRPDEVKDATDDEYILSHHPVAILVHFPGVTWRNHPDLDIGVYPLAQVSRTWEVNKSTEILARRTGYFLILSLCIDGAYSYNAGADAERRLR